MAYDHNNIFARIIRGEIPSKKVYEDEWVLAIHDIAPAAPVHVLVMPKGDHLSFDDFMQTATPETVTRFFRTAQKIAQSLNIVDGGYRIISNHGAHAAQSVPHFHLHILAGRLLGGLVPGDEGKR